MRSTACVYRAAAASSPKNSSWPGGGTPKQNPPATHGAASSPERGARENPSSASNPRAALHTVCASSQVSDKIETQSNVRRSEERRGGKECRSRWAPDHYTTD